MVRLLLCLSLLLTWSNANAWYCSYTPTTAGYISNLHCEGIDPTVAVQNYWCPYRNQDPICRQFDQPIIAACSDRIETQSLACPVHYSGVINQSRTFVCSTQSYTSWTTTSNNCTQDSPTCHVTTETQTVACQAGYTGSITQTRTSTCPDPYGQPTFGPWVESANTCVKSITNVTNPVSPVSPIAPAPTPTVQPAPVTVETPQELPQTVTSVTESVTNTDTNTPKTNTEAPQSINTVAPISSPQQTQNNAPVSVPKGKELVPGFGIVMSMEIMNAPIKFQQQQLEIALDYSQELPDGIRGNQEFLTEIISQGSATNLFTIGSKRWDDLYRNYEVQPDY